MHHVSAVFLGLLVLLAAPALADKDGSPEKPWHPDYGPGPLTILPEQEPNDACPGQQIEIGDVVAPASYDPASDDDWYCFHADAGTYLTIGTDSYEGSSVDTYLELYDSCTGTRIAYDDDNGPDAFSLITDFPIPHSGDYFVKTFTYAHLDTGEYQLFLFVHWPPPPLNDTCNPDFFIPHGSGVIEGDMAGFHNDYDPGSGGCASEYPEAGVDAAYMMELIAGDMVDMTYNTPNWDAAFYVVTDCSNPSGSCVVGADAAYDTEEIHWWVPQTGTYYLILDHYGAGAGGGPWSLHYTIPGPEPGACCVGVACYFVTPETCEAMGGTFMGYLEDCEPNPCLPPSPAEPTTWGAVKASFR